MNYLWLAFMLVAGYAQAQKNPGPSLMAMGSGGTALPGIWSLQQNPAGIGKSGRVELAIGYQQHLLDQQLSTQTALLVVPQRRSAIGLSFERYGFSEYAEQNTGLTYTRSFGDSFRMGIGLRYYQLTISQYGSAKAYTVETGFQLDVTDEFTIAGQVSNPGRNSYEYLSGSSLPVKLSFGTSYTFSDKLIVVADIRKVLKYPVDVMTGIQYHMIPWFSLRGGVSANPFKQYAGFGLNYKRFRLDAAVSSHPPLGYSPQMALGYEF